jgi:hypothetical protein
MEEDIRRRRRPLPPLGDVEVGQAMGGAEGQGRQWVVAPAPPSLLIPCPVVDGSTVIVAIVKMMRCAATADEDIRAIINDAANSAGAGGAALRRVDRTNLPNRHDMRARPMGMRNRSTTLLLDNDKASWLIMAGGCTCCKIGGGGGRAKRCYVSVVLGVG